MKTRVALAALLFVLLASGPEAGQAGKAIIKTDVIYGRVDGAAAAYV